MHHPQRQNVTTSMVGLKSGHMMQKSHLKQGTPEIYLGNAEEAEEEESMPISMTDRTKFG